MRSVPRSDRSGAWFDLDPDTRTALELDTVLGALATLAATASGAKSLREACPSARVSELREEILTVEEARAYLRVKGRFLPARLPDPGPALEALAIPGYTVDAVALRDLASVLLAASDLRSLGAGLGDGYPRIAALARAIPDLRTLVRPVVEHVQPDGSLGDGASTELARLRRAIAKTGDRLRRQLESFLHDPGSAPAIRDDFVTQRNGRFVVPVRTDAPHPVRGIVHAASSSGQTLFVEPMASVELNNELVRLAEAELAEQDRVTRRWSDRFRERLEEIGAAITGTTRADSIQARALWAERESAVAPTIGPDEPLRFVRLRHPLLDRRLREAGGEGAVPIDLEIAAGDRVLVLSGPNAGGKTVALKAIGLAVLLAHCGIPVPASEARVPALSQLRADIGDHQSIDADLSTFSAHVRAVARWLDAIRRPALFLFDEIGTGTEPGEGAALARAVLERLSDLGVLAIATTHQAALKAWAIGARGVGSAAMEFDEVRLRPTFRVLPGAAGTSAGIEIAERLGLEPALVARAREILGSEGREAEALLARLRDLTAALDDRSRALEEDRAALSAERARLADRAAREATRSREEAGRALEGALDEFRREAGRLLEGISDAKERRRLEKERVRATSRLRALASSSARADTARPAAKEGPGRAPLDLAPGRPVRVLSVDREGTVARVRGDRVEVRLGSVSFTVTRDDLAAIDPAVDEGPSARRPPDPPRVLRAAEEIGEAPEELHLLGRRVDEALPELDRFLDRAVRDGRAEVRVIHGHGTGRLREAVRRHLTSHPLVTAHRAGGKGEGGDGATVVTLA